MTQMLNVTHQSPAFGPVPRSRVRPLVRRSLIVTLAAGALISSAYAPAFAVDSQEPAATQANVIVDSIISLTNLTDSFTVTGIPGETSTAATVEYTVETNNVAGYTVSLTPANSVLVATDPANLDTIPIEAVTATDTSSNPTGPAGALNPAGALVVHTSDARTASGGDLLSTEFTVDIPFVNSDTYTATLDYVASTV